MSEEKSDNYEQPSLPFDGSDETEQPEQLQLPIISRRVIKEIGNLTIDDDYAPGGLSERDRLGLPLDENDRPIMPDRVSDVEAYARALVERLPGPALVEEYRKLDSSPNRQDNAIAKALKQFPRIIGLEKEELR